MSWGETIFLKKFIQGEKRFVASDAPIAELGSFVSEGVSYTKTFLPNVNGIIRIKTTVTQTSENYDGTYTLSIYQNNNIIGSVSAATNLQGETKEISIDVSVIKGSQYTAFLAKNGGASYAATPINVCAQVTDANYFETGVI